MNIIETNIPDINSTNIDKSKTILADSIINNVYPLLDEMRETKADELNQLEQNLRQKKKKVLQEKQTLENLLKTFKRQSKIKKLLERIDKLVSSGILTGSHSQSEMVVLLKVIDKLPDEKIDYHLQSTMTIISKRLS